jgi:hypothetical protein
MDIFAPKLTGWAKGLTRSDNWAFFLSFLIVRQDGEIVRQDEILVFRTRATVCLISFLFALILRDLSILRICFILG